MPDETLARSRQKGAEKKEMNYCRKTVLAVGTDGNGKTSAAKNCRNKRGYVQAEGRLKAGTRTARNLVPPVEGFKRLKAGKRQARML